MRQLAKKPFQIYLDQRQDKILRRLAAKEKVSIGELIRCSLDRFLAEIPLEEDPAMQLIGLGHSGKGDLSTRHDYYLAQALRKKRR
jgi:hypothetical protein